MWIDPQTFQTYETYSQIREAYPNTSFPAVFPDSALAALGLQKVVASDPPSVDPLTQKAVKNPPALIDGVWQQTWSVVPLTQAEKDAMQAMYDALIGK